MKRTAMTLVIISTIALAACGNTRTERGLSGAGIGAGAGAVATTLVGGSPWTGAAVGGAIGGATGALTDKDDISLD